MSEPKNPEQRNLEKEYEEFVQKLAQKARGKGLLI